MMLLMLFTLGFLALYSFTTLIIHVSKKSKLGHRTYIPSSFIIPFRNEGHRIDALLKSFSHANIPKNASIELLFIDDFSEDDSKEIILKFIQNNPKIPAKIIQLHKSFGKKAALRQGIELAQYEKIICLDADIEFNANWLKICLKIPIDGQFVVGAVWYKDTNTILGKFDFYENVLLQLLTKFSVEKNAPLLANGAYMSFSKSFFQKAKTFQNHLQTASGDDMFLLEDAKKNALKFLYTGDYNHGVYTNTMENYSEFIAQKIRWARKSFLIKNHKTTATGILFLCKQILFLYAVFSLNLYLIIASFLVILAEIRLLRVALSTRDLPLNFLSAFVFLFFYPIYGLAITLLSILNIPINWKSRRIRT